MPAQVIETQHHDVLISTGPRRVGVGSAGTGDRAQLGFTALDHGRWIHHRQAPS